MDGALTPFNQRGPWEVRVTWDKTMCLTTPTDWPLRTENPVRRAQIRVILNTIVADALCAWRRAPQRTWNDISRLVLAQLATLDRCYPEAGILETASRTVAVQFFVKNADATITAFGRRAGDPPTPATVRLMEALKVECQ